MLELHNELGVVLSVAHFNHGLRTEAVEDENFVRDLANHFSLEFHCAKGDVAEFATTNRLSVEAAGRKLRYQWFRRLIAENKTDKIATAHTLDDQAETVLMRVIRGAGTRGLAGIHPVIRDQSRMVIIRPFLQVSRSDIETYLREHAQPWREDATNLDRGFSRNRLRHELLPVVESQFNPSVKRVLFETAEVARADEHYFHKLIASLLPQVFDCERRTLDLRALERQPLAVQRRIVRAATESLNIVKDFHHVEDLLRFAFRDYSDERYRNIATSAGRKCSLPNGMFAITEGTKLRFECDDRQQATHFFEAKLRVPGEVRVPQAASTFRATLLSVNPDSASYNPATALDARKLAPELVVRSWRAGDRFWPLHTSRSEKLKRLLQDKQIPAAERVSWPVIVSGETIVWVRGFPVASNYAALESGPAIKIDELRD
jgi:tRNA(Ile)-lysidine synthase